MAKKNRLELMDFFQSGDRPTQSNFEDFIDSTLIHDNDKASLQDIDLAIDDEKYITPVTAKAAVLKHAPLKTINNIVPDNNGNINITDISGNANSINGSITMNQVQNLNQVIDSKQETLQSAVNIKTINGESLLGNGNITIQGATNNTLQNKQIAVLNSDFNLLNDATQQIAFPAGCDQIRLISNKTYFIKGKYLINNGIVAHNTAMGWRVLDGAILSSLEYITTFSLFTSTGAQSSSIKVPISGPNQKILNAGAAASTAPITLIEFEGVLRCTTGGILKPFIKFSVPPTGNNIMKIGSFIELTEIGVETVTTVGDVF